jgi:hypothetical protein
MKRMPQKPRNKKYTDLCIYIDKVNYYRDDKNNPIGLRELSSEETTNVYAYIYNICYALAAKHHMLKKREDYEMFCLETAANIYMRLRREDQDYTYQDRVMKPIKSILNFIKGSLGFMCITWQQQNFSQNITDDVVDASKINDVGDFVRQEAESQYTEKKQEAYREAIDRLPDYIKKSIEKSIYRKNALIAHELYLSCCLSLCNALTLERKKLSQGSVEKRGKLLAEQLSRKDDFIITTIPSITSAQVSMQIKKALFLLEDEVAEIEREMTPTDQQLGDILETAWPTYGLDQEV